MNSSNHRRVTISNPSRHPAMLDEETLLVDCEVRRQRRSGPGGQHRNKVETAVIITHAPTGIRGEASERRSQEQNRTVAIRRLRITLAVQCRTDIEVDHFQSSALWRQRCQKQRITVSPQHADFPAVLAEAMNVLAVCSWQPKDAAERLDCSPSQLVKLIQLEPHAFTELNRQRSERGQRPLR